MGADLSRVRLNPLLDFAGVELKQGAVLLDADANELVGILDRRLRALASDILGRATLSATTPDAFRITLAGGMLQIGPGRLYVDGLLAENHGLPDPAGRRFDPLLAEPAGTTPISYGKQPYLPEPSDLPTTGRHLVYLDVWTREITHLEHPDLVETALGVETSSRLRTVWQVRVAPDALGADATCATPDADLPGWAALTAPSTGVLTTDTFERADVDDPCDLPPAGGYRGLENQLYRVEIHNGGQPGAGATFKWSRENASVASRVTSLASAREVELASLGRDDVLSFRTGDWVEIIDDRRELSRRPGEMRKVTVDAATRRIRFAPDLPADLLPAAFPDSAFPQERNLRVRRWDQGGWVSRTGPGGTTVAVQDLDAAGSSGAIDVPAATVTLLLEHGLTVRFDTTGPTGFRTGDFWVFAARTADAKPEILDRAPPRGIHHHFARLALWEVSTGAITDCRTHWPPPAGERHDCSCSACVTPESHASGRLTIQAAVDAVIPKGGTVCIGPGQYALSEPIRVAKARGLRIRGHGPATLIATPDGAFALSDCQSVAVEDLAVLSFAARPAISVETALSVALRRLLLALPSNRGGRGGAIALSGVVGGAVIAENAILAATGLVGLDPTMQQEGAEPFLVTAGLRIEDNAFWCGRQAIALDAAHQLIETRITGNEVLTCTETAVSAAGHGLPGSSLTVSRNLLSVRGGGLRLAGESLFVEGNRIACAAEEPEQEVGILLARGLDKGGPARAQVVANQITGFGGTGILAEAPVRDLVLKLNILERCGQGVWIVGGSDDTAASVENNHLRDIGQPRASSVVGIALLRGGTATVLGNTVRNVALSQGATDYRAGILAFGVTRARLLGNEALGIGPARRLDGACFGIHLLALLAGFEVSQNRVERDSVPEAKNDGGSWVALQVSEASDEIASISAGEVFSATSLGGGQVLFLGVSRPRLAAVGEEKPKGSILGNVLVARGDAPAVDVTAADVTFNNNRVEARSNFRIGTLFRGGIVTLNGNRVEGGDVSVEIQGASPRSAAVLGNITTGIITVSGSGLQPPWAALNLRA